MKTVRKKAVNRYINSLSFLQHRGDIRKERSSDDLAGDPFTVLCIDLLLLTEKYEKKIYFEAKRLIWLH